ELATDKRFLPYLDEPGQAWMGHPQIKVEQENVNAQPAAQQLYTFECEGEALPFFQRHRLALNLLRHQIKLIDRAGNEERWSQNLSQTSFPQFVHMGGPLNAPRYPYHVIGHLVVLPLGQKIFGIDPVGHQVLWEKNLAGEQAAQPNIIPDPRDGSLQLLYADGWVQRLGQTGPICSSYVCLQTREGLVMIDPVTGRPLWT